MQSAVDFKTPCILLTLLATVQLVTYLPLQKPGVPSRTPAQFRKDMSNTYPAQPIIYDLYEPSTGVWQYVVADPRSDRCLVIDPILGLSAGNKWNSTAAADAILELVRSHGYKVDRLLATYSSNGKQTAIWYLRMQLLESQGFAPQVCGGELVSRISNRWERKYGSRNGFTTTIDKDPEDGETVPVGSLRVRAMHLPGLSPGDFGFLVGSNVFGALSICRSAQAARDYSDPDSYLLGKSLQKIASLPRHFRLLPDQGQEYDPVKTPYVTIAECT